MFPLSRSFLILVVFDAFGSFSSYTGPINTPNFSSPISKVGNRTDTTCGYEQLGTLARTDTASKSKAAPAPPARNCSPPTTPYVARSSRSDQSVTRKPDRRRRRPPLSLSLPHNQLCLYVSLTSSVVRSGYCIQQSRQWLRRGGWASWPPRPRCSSRRWCPRWRETPPASRTTPSAGSTRPSMRSAMGTTPLDVSTLHSPLTTTVTTVPAQSMVLGLLRRTLGLH